MPGFPTPCRRPKAAPLAALLAALLALGACSDTARRGIAYLDTAGPSEPTLVKGEQVFMQMCNQCHPQGEAGLGFALNDKPLPGFLIRTQVRNGLGAMPAFSEHEISDEDLDAVVAYLTWLRNRPPPPGTT